MAGLLATALLRTQDDERLAALASAGHAGAFDVLVSRHARTLHAVARRVAGPDAADDVTQQALLRAWAAISGGAQVQHPSGWLHRIVRTTAIDARHAMPDDTELRDDVAADLDLPAEVQQRIDVRQALALLAALPEEQRVAVLAAVQGRTSADVADELGMSEGAVRQLAYRARSGLRAAMTAVTPYPLAVWAAQRMGEGAAVAAEAVGAGGSVLGGALLAKAGATVVVSGAVIAGVTLPDTPREDRSRSEEPAAAAVAPAPPPASPPTQFAAVSAGVGSAFTAAGVPARSEASRREDRAERSERAERSPGKDERRDRKRRDDDDDAVAPTTGDDRDNGERRRPGRDRGDDDDRRDPRPERSGRSDDDAGSGRRGKKETEAVAPAAVEVDENEGPSGGREKGGGDRGDGGESAREEQPAAEPAESTDDVADAGDTSHGAGSGKHDDD